MDINAATQKLVHKCKRQTALILMTRWGLFDAYISANNAAAILSPIPGMVGSGFLVCNSTSSGMYLSSCHGSGMTSSSCHCTLTRTWWH